MLTIQDIITECVRHPGGLPRPDRAVYERIWRAIGHKVYSQLLAGKGVRFPNFGTFTYTRSKRYGAKHATYSPAFVASAKFANSNQMRFNRCAKPAKGIETTDLMVEDVVQGSGSEREYSVYALKDLFSRIADHVHANENVQIDFRVGYLCFIKGYISMRFKSSFLAQLDDAMFVGNPKSTVKQLRLFQKEPKDSLSFDGTPARLRKFQKPLNLHVSKAKASSNQTNEAEEATGEPEQVEVVLADGDDAVSIASSASVMDEFGVVDISQQEEELEAQREILDMDVDIGQDPEESGGLGSSRRSSSSSKGSSGHSLVPPINIEGRALSTERSGAASSSRRRQAWMSTKQVSSLLSSSARSQQQQQRQEQEEQQQDQQEDEEETEEIVALSSRRRQTDDLVSDDDVCNLCKSRNNEICEHSQFLDVVDAPESLVPTQQLEILDHELDVLSRRRRKAMEVAQYNQQAAAAKKAHKAQQRAQENQDSNQENKEDKEEEDEEDEDDADTDLVDEDTVNNIFAHRPPTPTKKQGWAEYAQALEAQMEARKQKEQAEKEADMAWAKQLDEKVQREMEVEKRAQRLKALETKELLLGSWKLQLDEHAKQAKKKGRKGNTCSGHVHGTSTASGERLCVLCGAPVPLGYTTFKPAKKQDEETGLMIGESEPDVRKGKRMLGHRQQKTALFAA